MQTGSGKTYTMLGELEDLEVKPSPQRGMTPRIFEFLFARIQAVYYHSFSIIFIVLRKISAEIMASICSHGFLIAGGGKPER